VKKIAICCCLLALPFLSGCGHKIEPGTASATPPQIKGLGFAQVKETPLPGTATFVGTVESHDRGAIAARIDGQVLRIAVRVGEKVKAGQLLVLLGDNTTADRLRAAEAGLARAREGEATAAAHLTLAEKTYARYKQLFGEQAVTPQEMDQMTANLTVARKGVAAAKAAVAQAVSERNAARVAASYSRVRAPFAGTVVSKKVQMGTTVMPGQPLLVLDRRGPWQVRAEIPESYAGRIVAGETLTVTIPSLDHTLSGTVSEVQPAADPQSRSFQVKIDLPATPGLVAGLYARVAYSQGGAKAILIPQAAVVTRGQLNAVFIRKDKLLHLRLVKLGRQIDDRVEILSGLRPGETVVSAGAARAQDGARVED
jgi:RND family efflux transporter MFP subunit